MNHKPECLLNTDGHYVGRVFTKCDCGGVDMKEGREAELMHHLKTLISALEDAPHSSVVHDSKAADVYADWYRRVRGPALESTDPDRWKPFRGGQ